MAEESETHQWFDYPKPTIDEGEIERELQEYIKYEVQQISRKELLSAIAPISAAVQELNASIRDLKEIMLEFRNSLPDTEKTTRGRTPHATQGKVESWLRQKGREFWKEFKKL